jgi:hypothetical protein
MAPLGQATPPLVEEFDVTFSGPVEGICSFPVQLDVVSHRRRMTFFNKDGIQTHQLVHGTEQDTLSANGVTLVGLPYTFDIRREYDVTGALLTQQLTGTQALFPLPDGTTFRASGQATVGPDAGFILAVDHGRSDDPAALCAALST